MNPYDPMKIATDEGRILGMGMSGKYKKNIITRIGFFLLGSMFCGMGALCCYLSTCSAKESIVYMVVLFLLGLGCLLIGGLMLINMFSTKKRTHKK